MDVENRAYFLTIVNQRWLGVVSLAPFALTLATRCAWILLDPCRRPDRRLGPQHLSRIGRSYPQLHLDGSTGGVLRSLANRSPSRG